MQLHRHSPCPPRLNCLYRCGRAQQEPPRSRSNDTHGSSLWPAAQPGVGQLEPPTEPLRRVLPEANGHLLGSPPSLEQALGARLRRMGDQFHQEQAQRRQEQRAPQGALWGHLQHLLLHLLGILYNLPVEGVAARGLN
ncbi:hypothetical protein lerEdw1_009871 [Lerista edwardsae]|nr:hypothetical protein lerEdw1_009871 [Lerista edwardsae]